MEIGKFACVEAWLSNSRASVSNQGFPLPANLLHTDMMCAAGIVAELVYRG